MKYPTSLCLQTLEMGEEPQQVKDLGLVHFLLMYYEPV